jgi:ATP-dependent 26S proteasome regulatory subunit
MILFQPPDNENQMKFWAILPQFMQWGEEVNLNQIVKQYPLTGASIINVIHRATVLALGEGKEVIGGALLTRCIMDEQYK